MPWTVRDVDRHKHGLTDVQKRRWVEIANSVRAECIKKGGSERECDASAIRQANGVVGHMMVYVIQANSNYTIRETTHRDKHYIVVPVVMMVEGVHNGSQGPILHLAEELGRYPAIWNGIPVMIYHPEQDGMNVSANTPDMIDHDAVGRVYNTRMNSKLKAEVWLDEEQLRQVSPSVLEYIRSGEPLEVSVGVFTDEEQSEGDFHGEHYNAIARNHRPDHLALLPGGVGACSWEDGCGIRTNEKGGKDVEVNSELTINALRYSSTESTSWSAPSLGDFGVGTSWDELSAADKGKVASHYLIGSATAGTFGDLKLPVVNPRTGKLNERALRAVIGGRGAAVGGVSAETRSAARRRAYRLLNSEFNAELEVPEGLEDAKLQNIDRLLVVNENEGYKQLVETLQRMLDQKDTSVRTHFLEEAYDNYIVYRVSTRDEGSKYYRQNYTKNDGNVELAGEPAEVRKKVDYVAMMQRTNFNDDNQKTKEVIKMTKKTDETTTPCCEDMVNELITNERTNFDKDDKEWLMTLEEDKLKKLVPPKEPEKPTKPPQVNAEDIKKVLRETLKNPEEYLQYMPDDVRDQFDSALKLHSEQRARMVKAILENTEEGTWTEDKLKEMKTELLTNIFKSVVKEEVADYSLASGGDGGTDDDLVMLPTGLGQKSETETKKE